MVNEIQVWLSANSLKLLLGAGTVFNICWLMHFRQRLKISWVTVLILSVLHTVYGVMAVRLFAIMEAGFDLSKAGNLSLFGGVFFMPAAYFMIAKLIKQKSSDVFDIFTICLMFTLMCARTSCIISGCCAGRIIPGLSAYYPTREAEILFYLVFLIFLGKKVLRDQSHGRNYPIYMTAYGIFRFIEEWFRASSSPSLFHQAHLWAMLAFTIGLSIYLEMQAKQNKKQTKEGRYKT